MNRQFIGEQIQVAKNHEKMLKLWISLEMHIKWTT